MLPPLALLLHPAARIAVSEFTVHWSTVLGLVGLGALYEWRARQALGATGALAGAASGRPTLRHDGPDDPRGARALPTSPTTGQRASFFTGLLLIFLSLNGWLHDLSDYYLFSAHMVQHLVLTLVAPPLLVMGTPGWMLRPALTWRGVERAARAITGARGAFLIFNVVLVAWHLPPMYNLAMAHHPVHIAQHLCFMVAATLMWWPILSPLPELPRLPYPAQMLYLFLLGVPMQIVAAVITLSDTVLYPWYASAPRTWGLTPLDDQQLGGLLMWVPGGLGLWIAITGVWLVWARRSGLPGAGMPRGSTEEPPLTLPGT